MTGLSPGVSIFFGLIVAASILWIYLAKRSMRMLLLLVVWTAIQSFLALNDFFLDTSRMPPKLMVAGILPTLIAILLMFVLPKGRAFMDDLDLRTLTFFHTIRIPVEITLFLLFNAGYVSRFMTFEGTNFDIISGITAPIVGWLAFKSGKMHRSLLIGWNIVCLLLLLNVVITAVFALPSPFQKLSFDQPNVAVLYFPFNLLPSVVVPLVLFAHLVALRRLILRK